MNYSACTSTSILHPLLSPSASHTSAPGGVQHWLHRMSHALAHDGSLLVAFAHAETTEWAPQPHDVTGGSLRIVMFSSLADSTVSASCAHDVSGH